MFLREARKEKREENLSVPFCIFRSSISSCSRTVFCSCGQLCSVVLGQIKLRMVSPEL